MRVVCSARAAGGQAERGVGYYGRSSLGLPAWRGARVGVGEPEAKRFSEGNRPSDEYLFHRVGEDAFGDGFPPQAP